MNKKFFFLGLLLFYLLTFLSPHKLVYFLAYLIAAFFFYLATKNFRISLLFSLILSLFSDVGLGGSLFLMEPQQLNLGSGWWFSPMSLIILCLIPLSLRLKIKKYELADIALILFFLWSIISFLFLPNINVFYGIISLGEVILIYLLLRIYISKKLVSSLNILLISMLIIQLVIASFQYFFQRPIGLLTESVITGNPFGLTTPEESTFFRITGTTVHPNNFAAVILAILPFLLFTRFKNKVFKYLFILPLIVLFFTYSRAAWIIFALISSFMLWDNKFFPSIRGKLVSYKSFIIAVVLIVACFFILQPYITKRLQSVSFALSEFGSWGVRIKLTQEALSLISQYPITGVGLNKSVESYVSSPVTDLVDVLGNYKYYRIHNIFLEISAETGIIGLSFFILFLFFVLKQYFTQKNNSTKRAAFFGLLGLIGMSMLNPLFHASQFRLFFLLSAIILV